MAKGPNSFFIAPDSEFILNGTVASSNDATGLYTSKTVAATANSGSMSSFMTGTPSSNTTYRLRIQDSGSNYSGTYIYRPTTSTGSDDSQIWYGEPDRRFMWDMHNPLLKNYTNLMTITGNVPPAHYFWESSLNNRNAMNIQGVYFSVLNKEFIYVSSFDQMVPKLFVAHRDISNCEENWTSGGQITTLDHTVISSVQNINYIDSNKRGLQTNYEPIYSVCEHIDGKLKLAVKFNDEIDIYESTDGTSFKLIAKNILSRFKNKRFVNHLKMASSGPYLKIAFVVGESSQKNQSDRYLGTLSSSDGGASWDYTDIAKSIDDGGAGITVLISNSAFGNQNYSYDLCGLSDGSGRFILANSQNLIDDNKKDSRTESTVGLLGYTQFVSDVNAGNVDPYYVSFYIASGNGRLQEKKQMATQNYTLSAKPYLASNNDWIWLIIAGTKTDAGAGFPRNPSYLPNQSCSKAYISVNNLSDDAFKLEPNENSMFYMRIDSDLNKDKWKILGADDNDAIMENVGATTLNSGVNYFETVIGEKLKSGRTTGSMGNYFFIPSSGNLYSCGPYMAFCSIGWPQWYQNERVEDDLDFNDYGSFNKFAQYYRFSGWQIRPPYINSGLNPVKDNMIDMVDKFVHQEHGMITLAEFNYVFGKPKEFGMDGNSLSMWSQRRNGSAYDILREDSLEFKHIAASGISDECNFYYYRTPTVCDQQNWTTGMGQRVGSVSTGATTINANDTNVRYPMFSPSMIAVDYWDAPYSSWIQRKTKRTSNSRDGSCIQFIFGGVTNGSSSRNSIGIKINSFTKFSEVPAGISGDGYLYEYFLRMSTNSLDLYNTTFHAYSDLYRESGAVLITSLTIDASIFGVASFASSWWEARLSFGSRLDSGQNQICITLSIRKLGTEKWQDSTFVVKKADSQGKSVAKTSSEFRFLGFQGISFGLFPDSASTVGRKVKFRSLKVCQGSDMQQQSFVRNAAATDKLPPVVNLIRGRMLSPNPAYIGTGQSVSWGGVGGKFDDIYDTKIKSSYNVENTIKVSSPRFEYRTKGDNTLAIKLSKAEIVYQLPNTERSAGSLSGYPLNNTGIAIINTNVEKIKIEYDDGADFPSPFVVGEKSLKLISARVQGGINNRIQVKYDGESSLRNLNNTQYTSSDDTTYYAKFTTGSTGSLQNKSYKVIKSFGSNLSLDVTDNVIDNTLCPAGTTIEIYSDRMIATHGLVDATHMRITLSGHLGTTDYIKMGSLTAGISFNLDRVPINWEHSVNVSGNVTEFNSRSGVRWGYREGPSVRTFTGEIVGDVFDDERENIKNIAEQATRFNVNPIGMVFDGDRGAAFETGSDATAKAYIDPTNILYGTINPQLEMVNEGWRYDSTLQEWKVVGNLQLTVVEVV